MFIRSVYEATFLYVTWHRVSLMPRDTKNFLAQAIFAFSISRSWSSESEPFVSATKYRCLTDPSLKAIAQSGL